MITDDYIPLATIWMEMDGSLSYRTVIFPESTPAWRMELTHFEKRTCHEQNDAGPHPILRIMQSGVKGQIRLLREVVKLPTLLKRIIVGLVAGMGIGSIVTGIVVAVRGDAMHLHMIDVLGIALLLGGGLGMPVGVIVAISSSLVAYRTGWAWEWALVGASAAALTILALGRMQTPAALALLIIATGTSMVVERTTALLFHDQPYDDHLTYETFMLYVGSIGLMVASYFVLLRGLLLVVD